mmetsp:Transcript_4867/g.11709  ORF Transcript_4867/g.11709 Transcript_4867/m.11709 type:complete len:103 (+) Transcript_4867:262-570(+)
MRVSKGFMAWVTSFKRNLFGTLHVIMGFMAVSRNFMAGVTSFKMRLFGLRRVIHGFTTVSSGITAVSRGLMDVTEDDRVIAEVSQAAQVPREPVDGVCVQAP